MNLALFLSSSLAVNYPTTKDSWASGFADNCLLLSLTSSPPV